MKQIERPASRRFARKMPSENDAYNKSSIGVVADDTGVAVDEAGLPNATDQETEAVFATGVGEGAGAEQGHTSAQSPSSPKTSRWMMIWLYNSCCRKASR
jgi:hypothetical protein